MSPLFDTGAVAALAGVTAETMAPLTFFTPRLAAMSEVIACTVTPSCARRHVSILPQVVHDVLGHVGRDREADADVAARLRNDLRVDADQLSLGVDERAAGVAMVDGRVGLQEVLVAAAADASSGPWR